MSLHVLQMRILSPTNFGVMQVLVVIFLIMLFTFILIMEMVTSIEMTVLRYPEDGLILLVGLPMM